MHFTDERFQTLAIKMDTYKKILKYNKETRLPLYKIVDDAMNALEEKNEQIRNGNNKGKSQKARL
jgi:hypothetical protein